LYQNFNFYKAEELPIENLPASFDWRDHNAVTPAKDQGSVGTCWAFSTTGIYSFIYSYLNKNKGNVEGQWVVSGNSLVSLSEEQLNDCDGNDCAVFGGWPCRGKNISNFF
jgi:cathepsin F